MPTCAKCGYEAKSVKALAGHMKKHRVAAAAQGATTGAHTTPEQPAQVKPETPHAEKQEDLTFKDEFLKDLPPMPTEQPKEEQPSAEAKEKQEKEEAYKGLLSILAPLADKYNAALVASPQQPTIDSFKITMNDLAPIARGVVELDTKHGGGKVASFFESYGAELGLGIAALMLVAKVIGGARFKQQTQQQKKSKEAEANEAAALLAERQAEWKG